MLCNESWTHLKYIIVLRTIVFVPRVERIGKRPITYLVPLATGAGEYCCTSLTHFHLHRTYIFICFVLSYWSELYVTLKKLPVIANSRKFQPISQIPSILQLVPYIFLFCSYYWLSLISLYWLFSSSLDTHQHRWSRGESRGSENTIYISFRVCFFTLSCLMSVF